MRLILTLLTVVLVMGCFEKDIADEYDLMSEAVSKRDPGICRKISTDRVQDNCLRAVGILLQDIELCNEIADNEYKYWCIGVVQRDPTYCAIVKDPEHNSLCYKYVAMYSRNPEICEHIRNETIRADCHNKVTPV
ncbi:MAG: hypothetical protein ABH851_03270 [Methanobacteriota archaeon]